MSIKSRSFMALTLGVLLGLAATVGPAVLADRDPSDVVSLPWEEARLLAEVLERVKSDYVEEVDEKKLIEGAIRGMVAELDPHSAFLDSEEYREIRISTMGNYSGVGLEVNLVDGLVRVVSPIDDTPAQRAGIQPGDIIVAVDGVPVDDKSLNDTVSKMRGEPGSRVSLSVRRDDDLDLLQFELERTTIEVTSVKWELLEPEFGYLRISQFSETTSRDLYEALQELQAHAETPLRGLILDLRNNPGGVLDAAVDVSDAFLESGLIVTAEGRVPDARFAHEAHPGDLLNGAPLVVLVNAGSASASEIVAGALKDHERAVIMGASTYGKGSVQTVMPLSNGRAIKLTTSKYYTPSGKSIHERGIEPDVSLRRDSEDIQLVASGAVDTVASLVARDSVLRQALAYLKQTGDGNILQSKAP